MAGDIKTDYGLVYENHEGRILLKKFDEPSCRALIRTVSVAIERGCELSSDTISSVKGIFDADPATSRCYPYIASYLGEPYHQNVETLLRWSMSPQGCRGAMNEHPFHLDDSFRLVWDDYPPGTVFKWQGEHCVEAKRAWAIEKEAIRLIGDTLQPELERYLGSQTRTFHVLDYCRLLGNDLSGVMIGRESSWMEPEYDNTDLHLLTVGTPGSGKFTANIAPACLQYRGSLFVIDPDGEAAAVTASARFERHGQIPYVFDPFQVLRRKLKGGFPTHAVEINYNPLRDLDIDSVAFDADAQSADGFFRHRLPLFQRHFMGQRDPPDQRQPV